MKKIPIESQTLDLIARIGFNNLDGFPKIIIGQGERFPRRQALDFLLEQKLINQDYVSKVGGDREDYSLTEKGQLIYKQLCQYTKELLIF